MAPAAKAKSPPAAGARIAAAGCAQKLNLLHFPVVYGLADLITVDPQWLGGWPRFLTALALTLALTFLLASVTYRYIEAALSRWASAVIRRSGRPSPVRLELCAPLQGLRTES